MPHNVIRILLVDDDRVDRMAVERLVQREHLPYILTTASSQKEGLEKLATEQFDLVMVDYMLGDGTGLEILTKIQATTPVIFVTGSGDEGIAVQAMRMGAYDYLIKDPERNYLTVLPQTVAKVIERRRAEEAVNKLSRVIEQTADTVLITDRNGTIEYVNPAFRELTGYSEQDAVGKTPRILKSGTHDAGFYKSLWETVLAGTPFRAEFYNRKKDGAIYCEEKTITPIRGAQNVITHFVATGRDISARKRAENELRTAKERAEEATRMKDKFVSLVSHDLKGPLGTMLGFIKLTKRDSFDALDSETKGRLDIVIQEGERMNRLIEELLSISRLKTGKIQPRCRFFDGFYLAVKAAMSADFNLKTKGITLLNKVPQKTRLYADPTLFEEVIQNIISNAVKFSRPGDTITLFVPEDHPTTIAVSDTGVGIPPEVAPKLFLYDVKTSTAGTAGETGTGLGLPLSHDIMLAHNGDLTVVSKPDKGSTFFATLPHLRPIVLLAEDDFVAMKMVHALLSKIDVAVMAAKNGAEALQKIAEVKPHLIITDLNMPVMDGFELIQRLKAEEATSQIPIIVLTSAGAEERERVFQMGVDDFVSKMAMKEELVPRVGRIIG
ncbi:MAG: response regulator [Nitrospinae bacterium]|nr:response regulator [Nitrospinota bacterium]